MSAAFSCFKHWEAELNKELMFSSKTCEWETPQEIFDQLDMLYNFDLDPASTHENAKCEKHFTKDDDGLAQDWGGHRVFCNPPYGRSIGDWVEKGFYESQKPNTTVVMLLPARTDTRWFHDFCLFGDVHFIRGRLKFGGSKDAAPFPSMVVTFKSEGER